MSKVYVVDVGTEIRLDVGVDLSGATEVGIAVLNPNGVESLWIGDPLGTTKVKYVIQADDMPVPGAWKLQAKLVMPTGIWFGETVTLNVYKKFT